MIINNKEYKEFEKLYFIAEVGINHNGSMDIAKELIREAALFRANAVKFQKRDPKKLWTEEYLNRLYNNEYSFGTTYGEHKSYLEFSNKEYKELKKTADEHDIDFLVSGFDIENVDFIIKELKVPALKIPSPFVSHLPYLEHVSKFKIPIFFSTGMHNISEIDKAVEVLKRNSAEFVLMQCTSIYPTPDEKVNLRVLETFSKRYNCKVGYSGHDRGVIIPAIATTLGAIVIEKHFTLDRTMKGPDHAASLEARGLDLTIKYIKAALKSLGKNEKKVIKEELISREKYCFSLKAKIDIKEGDIFSEENLNHKSPRNENQKDFYELLGKVAEKNFKKDEDIV